MYKNKYIICAIYLIWIVLQIIVISLYDNIGQGPDASTHIWKALYCVKHQCISPSNVEYCGLYIQAPGYTNILAIVYLLTGSFHFMIWINLFLSILIVPEIYFLAKNLYGHKIGVISILLWMSMFNNLLIPLHYLTELPFFFLGLTGFILAYQGGFPRLTISSILFAIGYTLKPLILAFVLPAICVLLMRKKSWKHFVALLLPYFFLLQIYGFYNLSNIGAKVTTSTTGGFNLCMAAEGPEANFNVHFSPDSWAHIDGINGWGGYSNSTDIRLNAVQQDSIRTGLALNYIYNHPTQYLEACAQKPFYMFWSDLWAMPEEVCTDFCHILDFLGGPFSKHKVTSLYCTNIPYYLICLLFVISLFFKHKYIWSDRGLLLLVAVLGIGASCIFTVEIRYHYPYLFVFCIWAAGLFERKVVHGSNSN